jgi:hypothetical protein
VRLPLREDTVGANNKRITVGEMMKAYYSVLLTHKPANRNAALSLLIDQYPIGVVLQFNEYVPLNVHTL